MRIGHAVCGGALLVVLLVLAGCGDASMGEVTGTVKVDGEPIPEGAILFSPENGKGQTAGDKIANGHYDAKVPVGAMKVSISKLKFLRKKKLYNRPGSPEYTQNIEGLPAKYNEKTELRYDVKPGVNQKDWDLQSK
jgi:hypothetical protein